MAGETNDKAALKFHINKLYEMAAYCDNKHSCRRRALLNYFGQVFEKDECESCDNCCNESDYESVGFSAEYKSIVESRKLEAA